MYFEKVKKTEYSPHNVSILWALKNYMFILYVVKSVKFHELAGGGSPLRCLALRPCTKN